MPTFREFLRLVQTFGVPILVALVAKQFFPTGNKHEQTAPPSRYRPLLQDIGFIPRGFPVTYRDNASELASYNRISAAEGYSGTPDTTAVILNWSRFPNLLLISSLLCGPWLDGVIAEVFIWNNSPRHLKVEDFEPTGCSRTKLRIHNSPRNTYFQGRYLACAQANTPYCFIQDDDYLVRSEVIHALHARIADPGASPTIHLLPPHEHLSSTLREIHIARPADTHISDVHTSFAWLGHGTMTRSSEVRSFLALLHSLKPADDEMKMADNFFTILSNRVPELWFDQGFELGGGQPFTVGPEGDERNRRYILSASQYLESLTRCGRGSCDDKDLGTDAEITSRPPYTSLDRSYSPNPWTRAACRGSACVLETNIRLLPDGLPSAATGVADLLSQEVAAAETLGEAAKEHYYAHSPARAVDSLTDTAFRSPGAASQGDTVVLDALAQLGTINQWVVAEFVWLVDSQTEDILKRSVFEWSSDKASWHVASHRPLCYESKVADPAAGDASRLKECSVQMALAQQGVMGQKGVDGRYFRARLEADMSAGWTVYEIWMRGVEYSAS